MKYNLDDLISKSFEGKEKVSPEFVQSVIKGLQDTSGGMRRRNVGMIAACAGVVIVAGMTALVWKADTPVQKGAKWKTSALQPERTSCPDTFNSGINGGPEVISANTEDKTGTEGKLSVDSSAVSRENAASVNSENEIASVLDNQDRRSEKATKSEKRENPVAPKKSAKNSDNTEKDDRNPSNYQNPGTSSEDEKPTVTAKPVEPTAKPAEPGTIKVLGNYVQLCSMRQLSDSSIDLEMQHMSTWNSLVEEALENTAIYTYEQLQEYQEKTRERFLEFKSKYITGENFLPALEQYFEGLQQYDKAYFQKNVLYIHHTYETVGYDFRLCAVDAVEKEDGKQALDVQIERVWSVPDDVCVVDVMENHMFMVQIPKDVAERCDAIEGRILKQKEE